MEIRVVGPFAAEVDALKKEWNAWLRANRATVASLRATARQDAAGIGPSADGLASALDIDLRHLGDRSAVTAPNLASVMLLVEEQGKRLLLAGDGHADDIVAGLEHHGVPTAAGTVHLDVLKFQHHGSEHNVNAAFCRRVFADHYVFCRNGRHGNPNHEVVRLLLDTNAQQ